MTDRERKLIDEIIQCVVSPIPKDPTYLANLRRQLAEHYPNSRQTLLKVAKDRLFDYLRQCKDPEENTPTWDKLIAEISVLKVQEVPQQASTQPARDNYIVCYHHYSQSDALVFDCIPDVREWLCRHVNDCCDDVEDAIRSYLPGCSAKGFSLDELPRPDLIHLAIQCSPEKGDRVSCVIHVPCDKFTLYE